MSTQIAEYVPPSFDEPANPFQNLTEYHPHALESTETVRFAVKVVSWSEYLHQTPVLLQDQNGPCPLIALVNTLLLQSEVEARNHTLHGNTGNGSVDRKLLAVNGLRDLLQQNVSGFVDLHSLLARLGDVLLVFYDIYKPSVPLELLLESLPSLHTGLSVDPNIVTGAFSEDLSGTFFSVFGLRLQHGWVFDEKESSGDWENGEYDDLRILIKELQTFDRIQDFLLQDAAPGTTEKKLLLEKWLELHRTQLTETGLYRLNSAVHLDDFVVFFRNNHFSTLYKRDIEDFYLLVTDTSFSTKVVWQSINSVSGRDELFFSGDFVPVVENDGESGDYELSKQLQEEEDQTLARQLQQRYDKPRKVQTPKKDRKANKRERKREEKERKEREKERKDGEKGTKKSTCVIV